MILIVAYQTDKYTNTASSMFGKPRNLRAVILQKTELVRVNVVKQKRINIGIFVKSIVWKF
jgi:hypothetical protein